MSEQREIISVTVRWPDPNIPTLDSYDSPLVDDLRKAYGEELNEGFLACLLYAMSKSANHNSNENDTSE